MARKQRTAHSDKTPSVPPEPAGIAAQTRDGKSSRWCGAAIITVFALLFTLISVGSILRKSPTPDEPIHLLSGYAALKWRDYRANPEHPPLAKLWAALPLVGMDLKDPRTGAADWSLLAQTSQNSIHNNSVAVKFSFVENDAEQLYFWAKLQIVCLGLLLGYFVFRWSRELFGLGAASVTIVLYGLDPNVLAHSQVVHTDLAFAAMFFIGSYFFCRAAERLTWPNLLLTALFFGLGATAKYAYVAMLMIWSVMAVACLVSARPMEWALGPRRILMSRTEKAKWLGAVLVFSLVVAYGVIWCAYGFRYAALAGEAGQLPMADELALRPELHFLVTFLSQYRLVPEAWLYGQLFVLNNLQREAYLLGGYSNHGFWLYFPVAFLVKTPLPALLLCGAALVALVRKQLDWKRSQLLWIAIAVYFAFAILSRLNIGVRHILPIYPFLFVAVSGVAIKLWQAGRLQRAGMALLGVWQLWVATGSYPDYLAYFNELAGGSRNGHRVLLDSNLDWGQDLKALKRWLVDHNVDKIQYVYFGIHDAAVPRYYGIDAQFLPGSWVDPQVIPNTLSEPSDYLAISANHLYSGYYLRGERREELIRIFRRMVPEAVVGHSTYVYRVSRAIDQLTREAQGASASARTEAELGLLFENQGKRDAAEAAYRRAVSRDPKSARGHHSLGIIEGQRGDMAAALGHLRQAAQTTPGDADIRYDLALGLALHGESREAAEHFLATLEIDPNHVKAHYNLGITLAKLGDTEGAIERLRSTVKLDVRNTKAHYQLAVLLAQQGRIEDAIGTLHRLLFIDPSFTGAHSGLAELLAAQGRHDAARKHIEAAERIPASRRVEGAAP